MKKWLIILLLGTGSVYGQTYNSGDTEIDANLKVVNTSGNKNLSTFKLDITKSFGVPMPKVDLCFAAGMNAGDVYFAFELSSISRKPIETIITSYKKNKSKGWGVIAKEMGIKPGSDAFHKLKGNCKSKGDKAKSNGKPKANAAPAKAKSASPNGNSGKGNAGKGNSSKGNAGKGNAGKGKK